MDVKVSNVLVILITAAAFVIVVAGMRAASALINPFLLAVFLAMLFSPPSSGCSARVFPMVWLSQPFYWDSWWSGSCSRYLWGDR
jgi:predicted PurR-regulated permease PerM